MNIIYFDRGMVVAFSLLALAFMLLTIVTCRRMLLLGLARRHLDRWMVVAFTLIGLVFVLLAIVARMEWLTR